MAKRSKQRLDSTHVCRLLSHMSRVRMCQRNHPVGFKYLERRQLLPGSWTTLWDHYVESKVDPRCTVEALKTKFLQAGKDMCTILEWANTQDVAIKDAESIRLAQRVFDENYERDEQGEYQQTRAQPTERCIIRTSLRLNGVQVHHQGQNLGGLQNTGGGDGTGGTPGDGGTDSKLPHRHRHTKCVGERQARYGHSPFGASQHGLGSRPGPVCRWRVRVCVAPRSSRRYP